jgi:hypothetical protein
MTKALRSIFASPDNMLETIRAIRRRPARFNSIRIVSFQAKMEHIDKYPPSYATAATDCSSSQPE